MVRLIRSKKSHRWSKEDSARHPNFDSYNFPLGLFRGLHVSQRVPRQSTRGSSGSFGLRSSFAFLFTCCCPSLEVAEVVQRKDSAFLQIEGKQDLENSSCETLAPSPSSGNWYWTSFWNETSFGSSGCHRDSYGLRLFTHPQGQFQLGRFMVVTGITILVSLLLSTLWTLDDMGIRYFNRKDYEIKMVGKYMGTCHAHCLWVIRRTQSLWGVSRSASSHLSVSDCCHSLSSFRYLQRFPCPLCPEEHRKPFKKTLP